MLDQPSGSPDAYQVQQAIQQQAKREEVDAGMTKYAADCSCHGCSSCWSSGQATPENKAKAMMDYAAATIQHERWFRASQNGILLKKMQSKSHDVFMVV